MSGTPTVPVDQTDAPATAIDKIITEYQLAKRALRWMIEHRVYWDERHQRLLMPVSFVGRQPLCEPTLDILAFIHGVAREADLDAEHAS
jgi:hypothetical protein